MILSLLTHWQSYAGFVLGAIATGGGVVLWRWIQAARKLAGG